VVIFVKFTLDKGHYISDWYIILKEALAMPVAAERVDVKTNRKVLSISSKRQITIPQKFYTALGFGDEAECVMKGGELVIRPVKTVSGGEFAEQILEDLIKEGLSGEALLSEFKERQAQIRPAVESMLSEAEAVAEGKSDFATYDDVFGKEG
jgi:bifunctional DNA-binding transcriptional regulator/antitoxin component of YhaV-PrlF toxin-antitoxin module